MATGQRKRKPQPFQSLVGKTFGRWLVVEHLGTLGALYLRTYLCRCECGREVSVIGRNLTDGRSKGCRWCGHLKHGQAKRRPARPAVYNIWLAMHSRCYGNHPTFRKNYQSRGIKVCQRWRESFDAFIADMGGRPTDSHSIDRVNNDGNYSCGRCEECVAAGWPANCRWATPTEQSNNKRNSRLLTFRGEVRSITQWARIVGLDQNTIAYRLATGMSEEQALATPRRGGRRPPKH